MKRTVLPPQAEINVISLIKITGREEERYEKICINED